LDDGKIGGRIESVKANRITVKITTARPGGGKLRADKGINLPDTSLQLSAITPKDLVDLKFVAKHADIVEL
jgi:pyruvate kinase